MTQKLVFKNPTNFGYEWFGGQSKLPEVQTEPGEPLPGRLQHLMKFNGPDGKKFGGGHQ
jgi:hypothetical protein